MYSLSHIMSQISLKNSFGEVVFKFFTEIKKAEMKIGSFGCHFETAKFGGIFFF